MELPDFIERTPDGFRINGSVTSDAAMTAATRTQWSAVSGEGNPADNEQRFIAMNDELVSLRVAVASAGVAISSLEQAVQRLSGEHHCRLDANVTVSPSIAADFDARSPQSSPKGTSCD